MSPSTPTDSTPLEDANTISPERILRVAHGLGARGLLGAARELLSRLPPEHRRSAAVLDLEARIAIHEGDRATAERKWLAAIEADPAHERARAALAELQRPTPAPVPEVAVSSPAAEPTLAKPRLWPFAAVLAIIGIALGGLVLVEQRTMSKELRTITQQIERRAVEAEAARLHDLDTFRTARTESLIELQKAVHESEGHLKSIVEDASAMQARAEKIMTARFDALEADNRSRQLALDVALKRIAILEESVQTVRRDYATAMAGLEEKTGHFESLLSAADKRASSMVQKELDYSRRLQVLESTINRLSRRWVFGASNKHIDSLATEVRALRATFPHVSAADNSPAEAKSVIQK